MTIDDQEDKERMTQTYAALGIGLVCVLVGVPLWWKTTEIYRVQLPYTDIERLSHTKTQYSVSVEVISLNSKLTDKLPKVAHSLQETLSQKKCSVQCRYQVHARGAEEKERNLWMKAKTLEDLDAAFGDQAKLRTSQYTVVLLPPSTHIEAQTVNLGRRGVLTLTVSEADVKRVVDQLAPVIQEVLVREGAVDKSLDAAQGLRTQKPDKDSMRWFRSKPGYDVTFTLINPQPDKLKVDWDIQAAVQEYLKPFMSKLADFTSISVTSQVLHYVGLVARPRRDSEQDVSYYTQQDLPHLINPLEAKLGSHASDRPSLNFVVYVPVRSNSPLYIRDEHGSPVPSNAFLSPRWGGIVIYNTDVQGNETDIPTVTVDMKPVMEVFLTQLRLLLNIHVQTSNLQLQMSDLGKEALTDWELSGWLRCRCVENLATAKASLTSLAQLLDHISNIVINDDIGTQVEIAVESIQQSEELLASGRLYDAFLASRTAIVASEKAFFDQSLLELLYFPEDQKFAIYIPLFLPISIPVITSLMGALRWLRQRRREKKLKEEEKLKEQ